MKSPIFQRAPARSRRQGFTAVEVAVTAVVLLVAVSVFSSIVLAVTRQQQINVENNAATNASRSLLELMMNEDFGRIFALYNADESDDPAGPGTAPGPRFAVPGLEPAPDSPDGLIGQISFPTVDVGGAPPAPLQELREDLEDPAFGTPRDLNGDSIIDGDDHSGDYLLLPVRIDLRWQGRTNVRELSTSTMLCLYRRS